MPLNTTPGDASADSYPSIAEAKAYWGATGRSYASKTDAELEQALRRGTMWIDGEYGGRFIGEAASATQALEWPRKNAVYRGVTLSATEIPQKVKNAASEAAWREVTTPNSLSPDVIANEAIKQEKVGDLSVTYQDAIGGIADMKPVLTAVDGLLRGLVKSRAGLIFATTGRA